jgi:hypothetical protein
VSGAGVVGLLIFLVGTTFCASWAYDWVSEATTLWSAGSGGIGAVSLGLAELVVELAAVGVPLLLTFRLTRSSRAREWGKALWRAHVLATIGLVAALVIGGWPVRIVTAAVFLPVQVFFANAALAMWIGSSRQVDRLT